MMEDTFLLFSSLRYDPQLKDAALKGLNFAGWNYRNASPFYMLDYHRDRILQAAIHWSWQPAVDALSGDRALADLARRAEEFVGAGQTEPLRLRILVDDRGHVNFEEFRARDLPLANLLPSRFPAPGQDPGPDEPQREPCYRLVVDEASIARSEFTHFKTTRRDMYDEARQRASIAPGQAKEVLLVNRDDGSVMEGSITTPYLWRDGKWVTPPVSARFTRDQGSGGQNGTTRRWALER